MRPARLTLACALALLVAAGALAVADPVAAAKTDRKARPVPAAKTADADAEVLVRIGNEAITRGEVQKRIAEMPEAMRANASTPEGRQQLLDRMIEERIWLIAAIRNGVGDRPKVKAQIEDQRRNLLIRTWVQEVMAANPTPADSEARAYYDAHLADFRIPASVTVRHIQTRTEGDAKRALSAARGGQDFAKLAKTWSVDTLTKNNGGVLGAVTRDGQFAILGRQPAMAESVFALAKGRIGGPWKSDRGWHVMKVDEITPETMRPFEQVRPMIVRQLSGEGARNFYNGKLDSLRRTLGVTPDSAAIKKFVSQRKTAREMFQDAQARGPATERIAAYQSMLREYPDSDVAPQAQFMIGFIYSEELKNYDEAEKAFRLVLQHYPKSELAASAQWMVEHMRGEDVPNFAPPVADSTATGALKAGGKKAEKP